MMGLAVLPVLLIIPAPYGKFTRNGWGSLMPGRVCWVIQECPGFFIAIYYLYKSENVDLESMIMLLLYIIHYLNRCFIYGYLMSPQSTTTLSVVISAIFFNLVNGYIQAAGLTYYDISQNSYFLPRFWVGVFIWTLGYYANVICDTILRSLRKPGEKGYKIPYGGPFTYVSAGNYFTETVEWFGWAIACNNYSSWLFLFLTISNLLPRALSQHKWYLENFKNYSALNRKAYIPFLL